MKFVPHNYQRYCINRMITDPVLGLFLDMGLGKTVITLTAVNDLRFNRFAVRKVLVIAPKKVAEDTWTRESQKWDHLKNASGDPSPWKHQTADQSDQHTGRCLGIIKRQCLVVG